MPKYTGKLEVRFWVEAPNPQAVDTVIWETLDGWNAATPKGITWDDVEWNQYEEEGNDN
jgi:hypothetical protein